MHLQKAVGFDDLCRFAERLFNQGQFDGPVGQENILDGARLHGWIDRHGRVTDEGETVLETLKAGER